MLTKLRPRSAYDVVAITALFVALGGTAVAVDGSLPGQDTVGSEDIINEEVKREDLGEDAVRTGKVLDQTLLGDDIAQGAIGTSEVANESLTGDDIAESTLGQVQSAVTGGVGRAGGIQRDCDPEDSAFVTCATSPSILRPAGGARALVIGRISASVEDQDESDTGFGRCRLASVNDGTGVTPVPSTDILAQVHRGTGNDNDDTTDGLPLVGITSSLPAGQNSFRIECNQKLPFGAIDYFEGSVSAVLISPG